MEMMDAFTIPNHSFNNTSPPPHLQPSSSQQQPSPPNPFASSQQHHDAYSAFNPSSSSAEQPRQSSFPQQTFSSAPPQQSNMIPEQLSSQQEQGGMRQSPPSAQQQYHQQQQQYHQQRQPQQEQGPPGNEEPQFDIFEWYPKYNSCQKYFAQHAQSNPSVQAVTAFTNILLPCQRLSNATAIPQVTSPTTSPNAATTSSIFNPAPPPPTTNSSHQNSQPDHGSISLIPYIRRLVVTGLDFPGVLHGFFGEDWATGVGPLHEQERRNYLFAAKSGGWASVKRDYDMLPLETVPFMRPLSSPVEKEVQAAEKAWSEWLALEDWMVGERAPASLARNRQQGQQEGGAGQVQGGDQRQQNQMEEAPEPSIKREEGVGEGSSSSGQGGVGSGLGTMT